MLPEQLAQEPAAQLAQQGEAQPQRLGAWLQSHWNQLAAEAARVRQQPAAQLALEQVLPELEQVLPERPQPAA